MYTIICIFRVKNKNLEEFLKITDKSGDILESHGTLEHHLYFPKKLTGRQGSMGILNLIEMEEDEELLLGQSVFRSESHYYEIMKSVGSDDMLQYLNGHIKDIISMNRVVTSSFTTDRTPQTDSSIF